jgi:hypothetical protein
MLPRGLEGLGTCERAGSPWSDSRIVGILASNLCARNLSRISAVAEVKPGVSEPILHLEKRASPDAAWVCQCTLSRARRR